MAAAGCSWFSVSGPRVRVLKTTTGAERTCVGMKSMGLPGISVIVRTVLIEEHLVTIAPGQTGSLPGSSCNHEPAISGVSRPYD